MNPPAHDSTAAREAWLADALAPAPLPPAVSSRELVQRAVAFEAPPRMPCSLLPPHRGDFFELAELLRVIGPARPKPPHGEPYRDEWGVPRVSTPHSWDPATGHPLADLKDADRHGFPDAASLVRADDLAPFVRRARDAGKYVVASDPVCLYERLEALLGFESLLTAPRRDGRAFARLLDRLADLTVETVAALARLPGVDAFMTWQDLASQSAPHVPLDTFRRIFKPPFARIAAAAHGHGLRFVWHICGAVGGLIPELIDLGVDVIQLDQPRLVGHEPLADRFGGKVCFWNTVDTLWSVAAPRTPDELRTEVAAMIRPFARFGGGLMLRHYPFPRDLGLSPEFHVHTARAFAELGTAGGN